jgi:hypothetical protein
LVGYFSGKYTPVGRAHVNDLALGGEHVDEETVLGFLQYVDTKETRLF